MADPTERLKTASKQEVCQWVEKAHGALLANQEMIRKSFQVTGIFPALDGSENHLLRNDKLIKNAVEDEENEDEVGESVPEDGDPFASGSDSELD